jgi:long-chain acyl-CoA synthetase
MVEDRPDWEDAVAVEPAASTTRPEKASADRSPHGVPETLGDFVADAARRFGDAPALVMKPGFRSRVTTYRGLDQLALRVASLLRQDGVQKGDRVLLWAPNSPEWVAVFFGCHKLGAILVPLDVRSAPDFVATVIARTEPRFAFLSRQTARFGIPSLASGGDSPPSQPSPLRGKGVRVVLLEELEPALPTDPAPAPDAGVRGDDVAEIMFTSGTTGDPKGAVLTHANILSNVRGTGQVLEIKPSFRLLSLLPLSHMLEQTVGMLAPLSGGCRVVYPVSRQPNVLFRTINENAITMLVLVPQALQLFMNAIEREARRQGREKLLERLFALAARVPMPLRRRLFRSVHARFGGKLDTVICGGAYLDPVLARKWELMGVTVLQGYGATETSPIITCDRPGRRKPGAVGQAFPGVEIRIAPDEEILTRGPNVFQGYWRNPEATAAALEEGWYHTGDLAEIDADGYLHLKGRKKDLIVLANGQNVYPEDIETQLTRHPAVADAAVIGRVREGGTVQVHAVLLMREPAQAEAAVRETNTRLADHQQVQGFTVWPDEDFPRTHTLKIKKQEVIKRLDALEAGRAAPPPTPAAAASDNPLLRLIAQVSGVATAEIRPERTLGDDLNLDSLGRVELLSAIEEELGAYVDETTVAPDTTVAQLTAMVAAQAARGEGSRVVTWPLSPVGVALRELFLQGLIFPLYHLLWSRRVYGRERIDYLPGPVLLASNHHFPIVQGLGGEFVAIWMALPRHLRLRTATAADPDAAFGNPFTAFISHLCNAFPIAKRGNVRSSLEYLGRLLDLGWSVLIFPEGGGFPSGPLRPFLGGTGLIAVEARTPVAPVWVQVERKSIVQLLGGPGRGRGAYSVRFGEPLVFPPGTTPAEATERIFAAVNALDPAGVGSGSVASSPAGSIRRSRSS